MDKAAFLDWLYFERRARVTFVINDRQQKIYTAKTDRERVTFGKRDESAPLAILWVHYAPNGTPDDIKQFKTFAETVATLTQKERAKH